MISAVGDKQYGLISNLDAARQGSASVQHAASPSREFVHQLEFVSAIADIVTARGFYSEEVA